MSHNRNVVEAAESSSSVLVDQMALPDADITDAATKAVECSQTYLPSLHDSN